MSFIKNGEPDWEYLASLEARLQRLNPLGASSMSFIKNGEPDWEYLASLEARLQELETPAVTFSLPTTGAAWAYDFTDPRTLGIVNGRIAYAEDVSNSNRPFVSSTRDCRPRLDTSGPFSYAEFLGATHDTGIVAPWHERAEVEAFTFIVAWRSPAAVQQGLLTNYGTPPTPSGDGTQILFGKNSTGGPTLFFYQAAEPANPFGVTVGSYGSGWIVATWEQSAKSSRALYVDTTQTVIATAFTKYRTFIDLLQWCREGTTAADFDVAFAACFPRQLNAYERAAMQRHAGRIVGRAL